MPQLKDEKHKQSKQEQGSTYTDVADLLSEAE